MTDRLGRGRSERGMPDTEEGPFHWVEQALGRRIRSTAPLHGGDIHQASRLALEDGSSVFLKWNRSPTPGMFEAEANGLALLAGEKPEIRAGDQGAQKPDADLAHPDPKAAGRESNGDGPRIPRVLAVDDAFLVLEYVEPLSRPDDRAQRAFGAALARLHRRTAPKFGLDHSNWIGSLPQSNRFHAAWGAFFTLERILPQVERGARGGLFPASAVRSVERGADRMDAVFPNEPPALVHGDLWSGNALYDGQGTGVLIDPAVHFGHREMDLAMTRLFGGFSEAFHEGYQAAYPLEAGAEERTSLCQLYPLLVHANLFGGGYVARCRTLLARWFG